MEERKDCRNCPERHEGCHCTSKYGKIAAIKNELQKRAEKREAEKLRANYSIPLVKLHRERMRKRRR